MNTNKKEHRIKCTLVFDRDIDPEKRKKFLAHICEQVGKTDGKVFFHDIKCPACGRGGYECVPVPMDGYDELTCADCHFTWKERY